MMLLITQSEKWQLIAGSFKSLSQVPKWRLAVALFNFQRAFSFFSTHYVRLNVNKQTQSQRNKKRWPLYWLLPNEMRVRYIWWKKINLIICIVAGVEKQFKAKRTANFPTLIPMKISLLIPVLLFTICCLILRYLKQLKNMKSDWRGEELWRHPRRGEPSEVQHNFALFCVRLSESFCACYRCNQGKCCSTINAGKNISL